MDVWVADVDVWVESIDVWVADVDVWVADMGHSAADIDVWVFNMDVLVVNIYLVHFDRDVRADSSELPVPLVFVAAHDTKFDALYLMRP